jgi:hypothetical protein
MSDLWDVAYAHAGPPVFDPHPDLVQATRRLFPALADEDVRFLALVAAEHAHILVHWGEDRSEEEEEEKVATLHRLWADRSYPRHAPPSRRSAGRA